MEEIKARREEFFDMASNTKWERLPNLRRGCFECGGPHLASECPRRKSPKVMVAQANVRDLDEGWDNNNYEPLDILDEMEDGLMEVTTGAAKVKPLCFAVGVSHIDHLYLAAKMNGHACNAMIDSGATHNFITPACVTKFGLKPMPLRDISISFVQGSTNVGFLALDIPMEAEAWKGKVNFLVVPMTGFDVILGLDWADKYLIAHFGRRIDKVLLDNLDGNKGVVVSLHRPTNKCKQVQSTKKMICSKTFIYLYRTLISIIQISDVYALCRGVLKVDL